MPSSAIDAGDVDAAGAGPAVPPPPLRPVMPAAQSQLAGAVNGFTLHASSQLGTPGAVDAGGGAVGCETTGGAGCVCRTGSAGTGVTASPPGALQSQPAGAVKGFTRHASSHDGCWAPLRVWAT
jgi:hypothetical protein